VDIILRKLTRLRWLAIVKLALLLPISLEELLGLKHSEIEWVNGKSKTITICRRVDYFGLDGKFDFFVSEYDPKDYRKIKLPRKAHEIMRWLELDDPKNRAKNYRVYSNEYSGYICVTKYGKPFTPEALRNYFRALFLRARWNLSKNQTG
jgi:hypothetical protein